MLGALGAPAGAQSGSPAIASTDTNVAGIVADVTECKRKEGVLTLKIRFRNTGAQEVRLGVIQSRNYDAYYLTAGSKKYFILRDSEKTPLAPQPTGGGDIEEPIPANGSFARCWG